MTPRQEYREIVRLSALIVAALRACQIPCRKRGMRGRSATTGGVSSLLNLPPGRQLCRAGFSGARMTSHEPVRTMADLLTLDGAEIAEGYRDGANGEPEPGGNRSRAYWHGWRNGMTDSGRMGKDAAMAALAHDAALRSGR